MVWQSRIMYYLCEVFSILRDLRVGRDLSRAKGRVNIRFTFIRWTQTFAITTACYAAPKWPKETRNAVISKSLKVF